MALMKNKLLQISNKRFSGEMFLIIATIIWGGTFVIIKESLHDISTMLFIALRFIIALLILFPFLLNKKKQFHKKAIIGGFLLGLLFFIGFATQTIGLKFTTATKSAFITGSSVIIVPILQTLMERKPPTKGAVIGTVLVFTGILFLSSGGNSIFSFISDLGGNFNIGDFFTLLCAVFFAAYVVYLDLVSTKFGFWVTLTMQMLTTAVLGLLAAILFDFTSIEALHIEITDYLIFGLIYTALFATLITTAILTKFQKIVTPTKAAIVYSLEPIFASVLAFFLLNEKITNFGFVGAVLIISGLFASELYEAVTNGR